MESTWFAIMVLPFLAYLGCVFHAAALHSDEKSVGTGSEQHHNAGLGT